MRIIVLFLCLLAGCTNEMPTDALPTAQDFPRYKAGYFEVFQEKWSPAATGRVIAVSKEYCNIRDETVEVPTFGGFFANEDFELEYLIIGGWYTEIRAELRANTSSSITMLEPFKSAWAHVEFNTAGLELRRPMYVLVFLSYNYSLATFKERVEDICLQLRM